jgi:hypothetical protein
MTAKTAPITRILIVLLSILSFNAYAENSKNFGDYVVHFNAFRSDSLTPEIAKAYQLTRRNNRMVVNITVQKKEADGKTTAVRARVTGFASNLTGQVKNLEFREIDDGDAIYYLAQAQVSHRETLSFDIKVAPEGADISGNVKFRQQFFTD